MCVPNSTMIQHILWHPYRWITSKWRWIMYFFGNKHAFELWCDFDRASSLICGNKMQTRCNRGFCCRSYCLLNMFRAPLCPSSGAQEYYTVVAACGISCCGFQVVVLVWSWGLCVRFAGCCSILQTGHCCCSPAYLSTQNARIHTKCYAAASPHRLFTFLTNFKISDFNEETYELPEDDLNEIETCWSVFNCFNMNILN